MNLAVRAKNSFRYRLGIRDKLREELVSLLDRVPFNFAGGCSLQKAYVMAWLIRRFKLQATVDIGVNLGRSLFPQALAHKKYTNGIAYGIDPWSRGEARQRDNLELYDQIEEWVDTTDFEDIFRYVTMMAEEFKPHCVVMRTTSANAVEVFKEKGIQIDMVHIDGNHDRDKALSDVEKYLPLLRPNGFVVMDDISWESVKPAYDRCAARLSLVYERPEIGYSIFQNSTRTNSLQRKMADLTAW
jgi:hypothetical protein